MVDREARRVMRLALALLLLAAGTGLAADVDWLNAPNGRMERVADPVFGGSVALYRAGKAGAEPVVLVHGLGKAGAEDWAKVMPALAERYDVYALDLHGFGQSDKGNHLYSPSNYARSLEGVLGQRLKGPFTLVGHSMGGAVALAFAAAYPARVRRLVLVDAAGVLHRSVYAEYLGRAFAQRTVGETRWLEQVLRVIQAEAENLPSNTGLALQRPEVRARLLRGDPGTIAAMALVDHDFSRGLRGLAMPTLIVWSSDDQIAPLRTGQALASVIPGARLVVIPDAGHAPQINAPERFNAVLRDELRGRLDVQPYALPRAGGAGRAAQCNSERGVEFTGDYSELVLEGCVEVRISAARIGKLVLVRSEAQLVNSHVREGIDARESRLQITGGSVAGNPPFTLDASSVDAAGVRIEPRELVVADNRGEEAVTLRISISEVARAGGAPRFAHTAMRLVPDQSWTPRAGARPAR